MDKELEHVVLTSPSEEKIYAAARAKGMLTLREDAIIKALHGLIPFDEVNALGGAPLEEEKPIPESEVLPEAPAVAEPST